MTSTEVGAGARHRAERASRTTRRWPTVVLSLVLVVGAGAVVDRVVQHQGSDATNPVITLAAAPDVDYTQVVHGTLTKTNDCLSVSSGLLVWPVGTTWKAHGQVVEMPQDKAEYVVGQQLISPGAFMSAIPSSPTKGLPESVLDALRACSRSTGIRTVAFVSLA